MRRLPSDDSIVNQCEIDQNMRILNKGVNGHSSVANLGNNMSRTRGLYKKKNAMWRVLFCIFVCLCSIRGFSVELLSEGALDSVSAVAGESAEEILNAVGAPSAGLEVDDSFERLPFRARIEVGVDDIDDVAQALDFALTQEVESWASDIRLRVGDTFEVGTLDRLPLDEALTNFNANSFFEEESGLVEVFVGGESADNATSYQSNRVEQTLQLIDSGIDSIEYRFERYIELSATVDADPFDNGRTIGSGYISQLRSSGSVGLTRVRD